MHFIWRRKRRWRGVVRYLKADIDEYEIIKGHHVRSDEIVKETMRYMIVMWNSRHRHDRLRDYDLERLLTSGGVVTVDTN